MREHVRDDSASGDGMAVERVIFSESPDGSTLGSGARDRSAVILQMKDVALVG